MLKTPPTPNLRERARRRLERLNQEHKEGSEEIKGLRAAGYAVLGGPEGYLILPPEQD
jgi:hypothetical protein